MYDGAELIITDKELIEESWKGYTKEEVKKIVYYRGASFSDKGLIKIGKLLTLNCGPLSLVDWQAIDATSCCKSNNFMRVELTFVNRIVEFIDSFNILKNRHSRRRNIGCKYDIACAIKNIAVDRFYCNNRTMDILCHILRDRIVDSHIEMNRLICYELNDIDNIPGIIINTNEFSTTIRGFPYVEYYKVSLY